MAKVPGCVWIEGNALHWIDGTNSEWKFIGTQVGAKSGAITGSVWIDTDDDQIHYIDEYSVERYLDSKYEGGWGAHSDTGLHSDGAAKVSVWIDTDDLIHYIRNTTAGNEDYVHADADHADYYTDVHTDISHADKYGDAEDYGDDHTAINHQDLHTDKHQDRDIEGTYADDYADSHTDAAHVDQHNDNYSHSDQHSDRVHGDTDVDDYTDETHADQPTEIGT